MRAVVVVFVLGAAGCDDLLCVGPGEVAIQLDVRVAGSGAPAAWGTFGVAIDGEFVDTLRTQLAGADSLQLTMTYGTVNRPGVYEVRVRRAGFHDWDVRDIVVERRVRECEGSIVPAKLNVRLRRRAT